MSGHKYDPRHAVFLDSEERKERQKPEDIFSILKAEKEDVVLDLGAGIGFLTFPIAEIVRDGKVYGVDVQEEMVKKLKQRCSEKGFDNVEVISSSESKVPLPDNEVDKVYMINVLHEIDDHSTLEETHRVMKKGAELLVVDWDKEKVTENGPPTHVRLSLGEAVILLEQKDFRVEDTGKDEDHYWLLAEKVD